MTVTVRPIAFLALMLAIAPLAVPSLVHGQAKPKTAVPAPATAAAPAPATTPYDAQLARLSEIIGALHYLRPLCGATGEDWRADIQKVLDADAAAEPARRERLTAAFNRGYRSFAAIHTVCTAAALKAEARYRAEAATLVTEITGRYGN